MLSLSMPDTPLAFNATLRTAQEVEDAVAGLKRLGLKPHPAWEKNWDLYRAILFVTQHMTKNATILDAGARWSPILQRLEQLGYERLFACDTEQEERGKRSRLKALLRPSKIRFTQTDITQAGLRDDAFDVVTCISVIEHGVDPVTYFREVARILKPGGMLITSTDYWCESIDTTGIYPYGERYGQMKVFTPSEIRDLVTMAAQSGLRLFEDLHLDCQERVVTWERVGRQYTFTFWVLQKDNA